MIKAQLDVVNDFEDESDDDFADEITARNLERIVLSATDWTAETILNQLGRGNINLSPRFQRRDAWQRMRKSKFIESLILNFPVPQIVLAEQRDVRGKFIVLDGKQRLTALLTFAGKAEIGTPLNNFALTGMDVLDHLNRVDYATLMSNPTFSQELDAFHNQTIRTVVIRNWESEALLNLIFVRLNTSSVPLSPQELRQALFPGPFVDFIDDSSFKSDVLKEFMGLTHADFRMRDVEILLRYLAFSFYLNDYSGNMRQFLNSTTEKLNEVFRNDRSIVEQAFEDFEQALSSSVEVFGNDRIARRWTGSRYERPWNRAILDVLLYYFSDEVVRTAALNNREAVVVSYQNLFQESPAFREAVAATTKSLTVTLTRFELWGEALAQTLSVPIIIPHMDERSRRIVANRHGG